MQALDFAPGFSAACITYACADGETAAFQFRVGEKTFMLP
jgi:hypothetical protein